MINEIDFPTKQEVRRWAIAQTSQSQRQGLRLCLSSLVFGIFTWLLHGCKVVATALRFVFQVRAEERQKELHQQCLSLLSEKQNHSQKRPPWARTKPYDQSWLPGRLKTSETKLLGLARAHCVYEENLNPVSMEKGEWNENWVDN